MEYYLSKLTADLYLPYETDNPICRHKLPRFLVERKVDGNFTRLWEEIVGVDGRWKNKKNWPSQEVLNCEWKVNFLGGFDWVEQSFGTVHAVGIVGLTHIDSHVVQVVEVRHDQIAVAKNLKIKMKKIPY